jgi:serine/threonine-protein kinase
MGIIDRLRVTFRGGTTKLDVSKRFELLRTAVSGTMSNFYMARDRQTGSIVGLKLCDSDKVEAFEMRFRGLNKPSEGEIASTLRHSHIVETFEYGMTTDHLRYILMEYLDGPGLNVLINNKTTLLDGKRAELIRQMAAAIEHVHHAGYIHRDICPRNFICSADASSLKLIDFGLTLPAKPEFMRPGNRTGTPLYMAPEIVRRRATDQRVDIFSLGVTAYHLCTFELPWPNADSPAMTAMSHQSVTPEDIFARRADIHPELGVAIMRCLAADPGKRPQTVSEFLYLIRNVEQDCVPI